MDPLLATTLSERDKNIVLRADEVVLPVLCTAPHNCGQSDAAFTILPDETWGNWQGHRVGVAGAPGRLCPDGEHDLHVMHHGNGGHFCPTMFLLCARCAGHAFEPEPFSCTVWQPDPGGEPHGQGTG